MANLNIEKSFEFFLRSDFNEYKENEWLAICNDKVVAHGQNLKEVMSKAKSVSGNAKPLFTRIKKTTQYLHA